MKNGSAYRWGEGAVAAALLALGLYMVASASSMPAGSFAQPGPAAFPFAIGMFLVVVGACVLAGLGLRERSGEAAPLGREAAIAVAVLIAAAAAFDRAGALVTFAALLAVLYRALTSRTWWKCALFGIAGAALAWAIFVRVLGVNLPGPGF